MRPPIEYLTLDLKTLSISKKLDFPNVASFKNILLVGLFDCIILKRILRHAKCATRQSLGIILIQGSVSPPKVVHLAQQPQRGLNGRNAQTPTPPPLHIPDHLIHLFPRPDLHERHLTSLHKFQSRTIVDNLVKDLTPPSVTWTLFVVLVIHFMFAGV